MKKIRQYIPWAIATAFALLLLLKSCDKSNSIQGTTDKIEKKTDTIYITKVIKIPEVKQIFRNKKPKLTSVSIINKDTLKTYLNTYKDSTGVAEVTIKDSLKGSLISQIVDIKVKERDVEVKEKIITNTITIKQKPKFSLALGMKTAIGINSNVGAEATIKNSRGWNLDLGYNTNKQITIGIKKDIITLWGK